MLEEVRNHRPFLTPSQILKKDFDHQKFKIYKPYIMQNQVQLEFRNGDYLFLGVRISRLLEDVNHHEVQQLVYEKSQIFDEELVEVFPIHSQPKVFLREFVNVDSNQQILNRHAYKIQYRLYFGFLIPKFRKTLPLDISHMQIIGFKHGLMLLHQFIDFIIRIHQKDQKFGYLDFQNIYFVENREQANQIQHASNTSTS